MRFIGITLLFIGVTCQAQEPDTLIYIDRAEHEASMAVKDAAIDSLRNLLNICREFQNSNDMVVVGDTFRIEVMDSQVKATLKKEGHNVWYDFEDGDKRINADYFNYRRQIMLMDSTYTVGSLFYR